MQHVRPDELRATAAYAGIKFTETEPLYGDAYGQVVVSLTPREGEMLGSDEIVAAMRAEIEALPLAGKASFTLLSGGRPRKNTSRSVCAATTTTNCGARLTH